MLFQKKIFITGGGGFIGSWLAQRLSPENQVFIYDNFSRQPPWGKDAPLSHPNLTVVKGDILDNNSLKKSIHDFSPTHIVHCAAICGVDVVLKRPTDTLRVNILGTANLLNILKDLSVKPNILWERIILFSTSEIFGHHALESSETHDAVIRPAGEVRWTYAASKIADEHLGLAYYKEFGLPCSIVRPFNIYGPRQVSGAMATFIQQALKNRPIPLHGDGNQIRSWCFIEDMIQCLMLVLTNDRTVGETFNIGNPKSVIKVSDLAKTVCRLLHSDSSIIFSGRNDADISLRIPDIKKSRELLGFDPKVDLEEGILKTAEFYKTVR